MGGGKPATSTDAQVANYNRRIRRETHSTTKYAQARCRDQGHGIRHLLVSVGLEFLSTCGLLVVKRQHSTLQMKSEYLPGLKGSGDNLKYVDLDFAKNN